MEELNACPVCEHHQFKHYLTCKDYTVSRETFSIVKCANCGFLFTNPRPAADEIGKYYKSEDYISHSATRKGLMNSLYHVVRNYTIKNKYEIVTRYTVKNPYILDIGSGTGEFLNYSKQKGCKTLGIEPSEIGRSAAVNNYKLDIYTEDYLMSLPDNSVDVITMWHVLEHVHELNDRISRISSLLNADGKAFIAVPNHDSYDAQSYNRFWAAYDVPRHLYHFDKQSITQLFMKHKMKLIGLLPMKIDAYYVSMLSEKCKTGKINYLKALLMGLRSNLKAGSHADRYSSVIFIFGK